MPNWKIHLEIAKRLNKKFNYTQNKLEEFYLGNILPDINNCFIVKDISTKLEHKYTHYQDEIEIPSYKNFEKIYKNKIYEEPIIFGYYIHLYTDYTWNNYFYTNFNDNEKLRGLSRNQYCIGIGYDGTNIIAIVEGFGKTSSDLTKLTFINHIEENSRLIHDDEKAHRKLVKELKLVDESYSSAWLKTKTDKENPLRPINHQCDLIRQFLNTHSGFDRDDLQDYLNLYCFMNSKPRNKLEKVNILLELAFNTKVTLKYRDLFETKETTD